MHLHVAIPAIDELDHLPVTLDNLAAQRVDYPFTVYVCVNQPESWWNNPDKIDVCQNNQQLIKFIRNYPKLPVEIIDKSSLGNGWGDKNHGVGWARRTLFDHILSVATAEDVIVSLDADTCVKPEYLQSIGENFENRTLTAVSLPYYHRLTDDDAANRAILRYEIYMRSYLINLYGISSPYNFTAVGSAIAVRVEALRKIGNITPMKSGEDFYLLQKLRKMAPISNWNAQAVYPAARFSARVYFGTGPAMIKGNEGHWESYPIYHYSLFSSIKDTYLQLAKLYTEDFETPFLQFLKEQYRDDKLWVPIRQNSKTLERFERAFHEKADGLRILQYLKEVNPTQGKTDSVALRENMMHFFDGTIPDFMPEGYELSDLTIEQLDIIRNMLFEKEMQLRKCENN
mgnify:FL=1